MDYMMNNVCDLLATQLFQHLWQIGFLIVLLLCSAFFSGSETAYFNLPRRTVRQYRKSAIRFERLVALILLNPNRFLTALLFGNMLVNVLYFAVSSMLSLQIGRSYNPAVGTLTAVLCFVLLLLFGEMLPKTMAFAYTKRFCLVTSPACFILLRGLTPILRIIDFVITQPVIRLFIPGHRSDSVSVNQLKVVMESSRRRGLISNDENQLWTEILKFSFLKVRHVMEPRVEIQSCSIQSSAEQVKQQMLKHDLVKMPVYHNSVDSVVGIVHLRDIFLWPQRQLSEMIRKVHFIPEQKTVESLVEFFRESKVDMAMVVDEYGGIAGRVDIEDVMEELLGPLETSDEDDPIEQVGPMQYRLMANLSIHDWTEAFGIDVATERLTTIGGFVTALLGKIPQEGDRVTFKNMTFQVDQVQRNRIQTITLSLEPLSNSKGSGS
jgi:CBS domain containing-hemolysin-like protein